MNRTATLNRKTKETDITATLCLDGSGNTEIETGIGFFDHMLTLFGRHGFFDLSLKAIGDTHVDAHHTVEDAGIVIGLMIKETLADKAGICRYGNAVVPMDESLAQVTIDISGRAYLVFNADLPKTKIGDFDAELVEEFFQAISVNAGITIHINLSYGKNGHHMIEAIFKAFARALFAAVTVDAKIKGVLSTKGLL